MRGEKADELRCAPFEVRVVMDYGSHRSAGRQRMPNSRCQKQLACRVCPVWRRARCFAACSIASSAVRSASGLYLIASSGCTSVREYISNGFKVGPDYREPPAAVAPKWIDANDKRVKPGCDDHCQWWKVFNDPALDALDLHRVSPKPHAPRSRLPHFAGPGPIGNRDAASSSRKTKT